MLQRSHKYPDEKTNRYGNPASYVDTIRYDAVNKNLDVAYQRLKIFNIMAYPELSVIRSLFIDHNNLTILPEPNVMPHLKELTCSVNKITHVPFYPKLIISEYY